MRAKTVGRGLKHACRWALALALCGPAWAGVEAEPRPDEASQRARVQQIDESSVGTREEALAALAAVKTALPSSASHALRRELLQAIRTASVDAGRFADADRANKELHALAKAAGDNHGLADARVHDALSLIRENRADEVRGALGAADRLMGADAPVWLRLRRLNAYGRLYTNTAEFENATSDFLDQLALARRLPRRAEQESQAAMGNLVHLYLYMHDFERALATVNEALGLPVAQPDPRILSRLYYSKALALLNLKRGEQARQAFDQSLAISREAGMAVIEAFVLANLADAELRAERWVAAERLAREAYAVSSRIKDDAAAAIARANIGFALGGQGKLADALPWIDGVIDKYRKAGNQVALYEMLDEKGRMFQRAGMAREALAVVREQQAVQKALFTTERTRTVAGLQEKFEAESRRRQIELLQRDNRIKDADIDNRKLRQLATTLVAALMVALGIFIFVLYRRAGKSNAALRELNAKLEYHAVHDPLTGLFNRRSFVERMRQRVPAALERRQGGAGDCLILLDIDHFKLVNDTYGHAAGDAVLVEVAQRLHGVVRDTDMVLRWGGEEFMVYSPGTTHGQALVLVERILAAVGQAPVAFEQHSIDVTTSAGCAGLPFAILPESVFDWERVIALADAALYLAKSGGRNRACAPGAVHGSGEAVLQALDAGLEAAAKAGVVELSTVAGPSRRGSPGQACAGHAAVGGLTPAAA